MGMLERLHYHFRCRKNDYLCGFATTLLFVTRGKLPYTVSSKHSIDPKSRYDVLAVTVSQFPKNFTSWNGLAWLDLFLKSIASKDFEKRRILKNNFFFV